jgi:hypothetical protein
MIATLILTTRSLAEFQARPERESEGQAAWSQLRNTRFMESLKKGDSKPSSRRRTKSEKKRLPHNNPLAHHVWSSPDAYENAIGRPYEERAAKRSGDLAESNLEKVN